MNYRNHFFGGYAEITADRSELKALSVFSKEVHVNE